MSKHLYHNGARVRQFSGNAVGTVICRRNVFDPNPGPEQVYVVWDRSRMMSVPTDGFFTGRREDAGYAPGASAYGAPLVYDSLPLFRVAGGARVVIVAAKNRHDAMRLTYLKLRPRASSKRMTCRMVAPSSIYRTAQRVCWGA